MEFIDYFERAYVINLADRHDRRRMITRQLQAAGMPLTANQVEIFPAIRPTETGNFANIGMRGCLLSHLAVLKRAQQQNLARVLIIEDDLIIPKRFQHEQANLVRQLQQTHWDYVCFGHQETSNKSDPLALRLPAIPKEESLAAYLNLGYLPTTAHATPTHFYGVNGRILDRLIAYLEAVQHRPAGDPQGGATLIDGLYTLFGALNPDVTILKTFPNLGFQASTSSDIHDKKWFEKNTILKPLTKLGRQGKIIWKTWQIN